LGSLKRRGCRFAGVLFSGLVPIGKGKKPRLSSSLSSDEITAKKLSAVVHTCNPSTWEAEAGGLQIEDQSELHRKTLPQKKKKEKEIPWATLELCIQSCLKMVTKGLSLSSPTQTSPWLWVF
jgi:hypothetical protein